MYKILLTIFALFVVGHSYSQFIRADHKKAALIYHRPVIVTLFDIAEAETACDSARMQWYNENIVDVMKEHWKLNDSIITMEPKRFVSMIGSKSPEYAVFTAKPSREGQQSSSDIFWYRSFTFMLYLSEDGMRIDPEMVDRNSPLIPDSDNSGQLLRGRYIFKLSMVDFRLSISDLVFVIGQFNYKVQEALDKRYSKRGLFGEKIPTELTASLQTRTLLIPNDLFAEEMNEEQVGKLYRYPFRICSQEEINSVISSKEENMAYIHYFWSDQERMFLGAVIDTHNGNVLAMLKPRTTKLKESECLPAGTSYRTLLQIKSNPLKRLSRAIR
jgi:hypothetical protein